MSAQADLFDREPTTAGHTAAIVPFPASRMIGAHRTMAAAILDAKPRQRLGEFDRSISLLRKRLTRLGVHADIINFQTAELTRALGRELKRHGLDGGWDAE